MQAHKIETVISANGKLVLEGLPFQEGEAVEVIVLQKTSPHPQSEGINLYPLQGQQPYSYDEPFEPAMSLEDWEALK